MNILYIFVEIIKKSTTMKNLIATLILTVSTLVGFSQVISVHVTGFKTYSRPKNETLLVSQINGSINYSFFEKLDAEYIFDLSNKVYTQIDNITNTVWKGEITNVRFNENIIDVSVNDVDFKLLPQTDTYSNIFMIEYNDNPEITEGFFSKLSDFTFEYK